MSTKGRTWLDYMKVYDPRIDEEIGHYLLMEQTAYPFSDVRTTAYQLRSSIRAGLNGVNRCHLCCAMHPFHSRYCFERVLADKRMPRDVNAGL